MSNLQVPDTTLAELRRREPQSWEWAQEQIRTILSDPPAVVETLIHRLGLEGAHETLEASLDAGTMKFIRCPEDPDGFGLAFYCRTLDAYLVVAEDGTLRHSSDVDMAPDSEYDNEE